MNQRKKEEKVDVLREIERWKGGKKWRYKINKEIKCIQKIGKMSKVGKEDGFKAWIIEIPEENQIQETEQILKTFLKL